MTAVERKTSTAGWFTKRVLVLYGCDESYWDLTAKSNTGGARCRPPVLPSLCIYTSTISTAYGVVPTGIKTVIPFCNLESVSIDPHHVKHQYKFSVVAQMPSLKTGNDGSINFITENETFVFAVETSDLRVQWEKWLELSINSSRRSYKPVG
jgi:hypothetical protein